MPRPARIHLEGALYYVTCLAEPSLPLFRDARDLETYQDLLSQYRSQHGFKLYAYALPANQIHLCLEVGRGSTISQVMHDLNSRYTKLYGKRYSHSGHLFQGRYRAVVVEKAPYLLRLIRHVHLRPGALATNLETYRSGGQGSPEIAEALSFLGGEDAGQRYEEFLRSAPAEEVEQMERMLRRPVVGSDSFIRLAKAGPNEEAEPKPVFPQEEEEEDLELVPVPVRRRSAHLGNFLTALTALALLTSSVGSATLSTRISQADKVHGVVAAPAGEVQSASGTVGGAQLAMATPPLSLSGTEWDIHLVPMYAKGNPPAQEDHLRFEGSRVSSKALESQGFVPSNFTLTVQPDKTLRWETMQTHSNGETVFWRGEWDGREMRGIVSRHPVQGVPQDFVFKAVNPESKSAGRTL